MLPFSLLLLNRAWSLALTRRARVEPDKKQGVTLLVSYSASLQSADQSELLRAGVVAIDERCLHTLFALLPRACDDACARRRPIKALSPSGLHQAKSLP